jgi:hypothetical protein
MTSAASIDLRQFSTGIPSFNVRQFSLRIRNQAGRAPIGQRIPASINDKVSGICIN